MSSKELIYSLFTTYSINYKKSDSYEQLMCRLSESSSNQIDISTIRKFYRQNWIPSPTDLHLDNLKSGQLSGHNWHGAMPSMLHLSLQNKVRDHIDGNLTIAELIAIGSDIMKHEYFMVAAHDLCETAIIETIESVIPPIGSKSISDFIFKGIPYDLKITNYFTNDTKETVNNNKLIVAEKLLAGADVQRIRAQAQKTINNWGLNRFYFLVENQERWLTNPEGILEELIREVKKLGDPFIVSIENIQIKVQLIAI